MYLKPNYVCCAKVAFIFMISYWLGTFCNGIEHFCGFFSFSLSFLFFLRSQNHCSDQQFDLNLWNDIFGKCTFNPTVKPPKFHQLRKHFKSQMRQLMLLCFVNFQVDFKAKERKNRAAITSVHFHQFGLCYEIKSTEYHSAELLS